MCLVRKRKSVYTKLKIVCKGNKKARFINAFLMKNVLCIQNFIFIVLFSTKSIKFVGQIIITTIN